jgi:hypothetical protein
MLDPSTNLVFAHEEITCPAKLGRDALWLPLRYIATYIHVGVLPMEELAAE